MQRHDLLAWQLKLDRVRLTHELTLKADSTLAPPGHLNHHTLIPIDGMQIKLSTCAVISGAGRKCCQESRPVAERWQISIK